MSRTREFDPDIASDQALQLFWKKGYEGTTLTDLTEAMGINRPSLYATFGSKEGLFQRALARYQSGAGGAIAPALELPTAREVVTAILRFYADAAGMPDRPKGCFLVNGALVCGPESDGVRTTLAGCRSAVEDALVTRLERAKRDGDLPATAKPTDLARYVWTVCFGLSVQANGGATRDQLRRVVQLAMTAWPA